MIEPLAGSFQPHRHQPGSNDRGFEQTQMVFGKIKDFVELSELCARA